MRPILAIKIRMGLFEHPYTDETEAGAGARTAREPPGSPPGRAAFDGAAA